LLQILQRTGVVAAAAEHRIGAVPAGEPCVIVAVSSAHRAQAFAAAQEAMDRIKADAPIWKREVTGTQREWVLGPGRAGA
jgi:molybdopterin synthase catalytic subunit